MILQIDFDGTIAKNKYPEIGEDTGAIEIIKKLQSFGHKIYLFTIRKDEKLVAAIKWMKDRGVDVDGCGDIKRNDCNIIIDDIALGCPCTGALDTNDRTVDWSLVDIILNKRGFYK